MERTRLGDIEEAADGQARSRGNGNGRDEHAQVRALVQGSYGRGATQLLRRKGRPVDDGETGGSGRRESISNDGGAG